MKIVIFPARSNHFRSNLWEKNLFNPVTHTHYSSIDYTPAPYCEALLYCYARDHIPNTVHLTQYAAYSIMGGGTRDGLRRSAGVGVMHPYSKLLKRQGSSGRMELVSICYRSEGSSPPWSPNEADAKQPLCLSLIPSPWKNWNVKCGKNEE